MNCPKNTCNGELVKVRNYYVCDTCCTDTTPLEEVRFRSKVSSHVYDTLPEDNSLKIDDPEYYGYYPFDVIMKTEWRQIFKLKAKDGSIIGSLVLADYSECDFIESNEPMYMLHIRNEDHFLTVSLDPNDVTVNWA